MNTAPAPNSLALSAGLSKSSHVPSATRYHAIAAGSAIAQNASSTNTYDATPAVPNSFTCANPLLLVSSFSFATVRSFEDEDPEDVFDSDRTFTSVTNKNAAQTSVGAAIIVSALSYDGSKKKSPAIKGVTTHAVELNTTNEANVTIEETAMPPPSSSTKVVVVSFSLRSSPFRYTANAATAHPAFPRNVRSACNGTSAFMDGGL
mmetsp:Transcript_13487/g.56642  ORF Transcript_13487/g.56642 Transcript_13487/m.56642 type:complete len:205 (+) Transcript_13487:983-1597(+)